MNKASLFVKQLNDALDEFAAWDKPSPYSNRFRSNLNVCIHWANKIMDIENPEVCFRGLPLEEEKRFPFASDYNYWINYIQRQRRAELDTQIRSDVRITEEVDLKGGRLFVMEPDNTLSDGISEIETNRLLDVDNFPPHGLWVSYMKFDSAFEIKGKTGFRGVTPSGYLLSYIPEAFVEMLQHGIDVNAEECIYWLDDALSPDRLKRTWGTVLG